MLHRFAIAIVVFCTAATVYAADAKVGNIKIDDPWTRSGQPGQMTGAFMEIKNKGTADKLVSASCDAAKVTELHASDTSGGVMTMRKVDAMDIPADGELKLKPGGYHVMLIDLKRPLAPGEKLPIKLTFEKAGELTVEAKIKGQGGMGH